MPGSCRWSLGPAGQADLAQISGLQTFRRRPVMLPAWVVAFLGYLMGLICGFVFGHAPYRGALRQYDTLELWSDAAR